MTNKPKNPRFTVRDTQEQLEKLKEAITAQGYKDFADWYRNMKRCTIAQYEREQKK